MRLKKRIIAVLIATTGLLSGVCYGDSGEHVGNGGGLAEANLALARLRMPELLSEFLASNPELLTDPDRRLVMDVQLAMPFELKAPGQLKIVNSKDVAPGFFLLDEQVRVARTGDKVGDTIFINRDLIYVGEGPQSRPIEATTATQIIFHELGHHHEVKDHDRLDALGAQVGGFAGQRTLVLSSVMIPTIASLSGKEVFAVKSFVSNLGFNRLLLADRSDAIDLTTRIRQLIDAKLKASEIQIDVSQVAFTSSWRASWSQGAQPSQDRLEVIQHVEAVISVPKELVEKHGEALVFNIALTVPVKISKVEIEWSKVQLKLAE